MEDSDAHGTTGSTAHVVPGRGRGARRSGATPRRSRPLIVGAALALGLAGCGSSGGGDPAATQTALSPADARGADTVAKAAAVSLAGAIESCFQGVRTYAKCTTNQEIGATDALLATSTPGAGEATISRATATGYRILTVSLSGNRFAITRQGSSVIRSCAAKTPLGKAGGGCRGNGW